MGSSSVRPISPESAGARVHIVAPGRFADAQEIANRLMNNQPVIVNMQSADRDLQRRMIDFCSGVTYALSGGMERVADEVFLLTPSNVKVSDEERQRLADRGWSIPEPGWCRSLIGGPGTGKGSEAHGRTHRPDSSSCTSWCCSPTRILSWVIAYARVSYDSPVIKMQRVLSAICRAGAPARSGG